jgi:flagellar hook-length control protein FliK
LPQFLEKLAVRVDGPAGSAFVELEPVALGRLTIELSLQPEGGVRAEVRAERPDGYAAIEARLPELRASLIGRGFASADVQLSLGLSQRDSRGNSEPSSPRRSRRDAGRDLETERALALAPSPSGSIDLWA